MRKLYDRVFFWITANLACLLVKSLNASYRFVPFGEEHRRAAEAHHPATSFALAVWHENLFASILSQIGSRYSPLASKSRDGDYITKIMTSVGFEPVRGSSSRGGADARTQMLENLTVGINAAITVDGPTGPRRVVKAGVVDIARKSGVAILPVAVVADRYWTFRSWDRFRLPKPFCRIAVRYGRPIIVAPGIEKEAFEAVREELKRSLDELDVLAIADMAPVGSRSRIGAS